MEATVARATRSSENRLISRALKGEQDAFAELYEAHKNHVYALCLRMTTNVAEAEDLTQDAFIQVFRKIGSFRGDSALSTWIYRVAMNTALMHFRKKVLRQISLDQPQNPDKPAERINLSQEDGRLYGTVDRIALIRAIGELPYGYRTIFLLHDVEGYGHQEIARMLKCSIGNTKSQLHKARLKIRESLQAKEEEQVPVIGVPVCESQISAEMPGERASTAMMPRLREQRA